MPLPYNDYFQHSLRYYDRPSVGQGECVWGGDSAMFTSVRCNVEMQDLINF